MIEYNLSADVSSDCFEEEEHSLVRDLPNEILRSDNCTTTIESVQEQETKTSSESMCSMQTPNIELKSADEGTEGITSEPTNEG